MKNSIRLLRRPCYPGATPGADSDFFSSAFALAHAFSRKSPSDDGFDELREWAVDDLAGLADAVTAFPAAIEYTWHEVLWDVIATLPAMTLPAKPTRQVPPLSSDPALLSALRDLAEHGYLAPRRLANGVPFNLVFLAYYRNRLAVPHPSLPDQTLLTERVADLTVAHLRCINRWWNCEPTLALNYASLSFLKDYDLVLQANLLRAGRVHLPHAAALGLTRARAEELLLDAESWQVRSYNPVSGQYIEKSNALSPDRVAELLKEAYPHG